MAGTIKEAELVHHVDNDYTNNADTNLESLCYACHNTETFTK
jgi:hypothetical protein